MTDGMGHYPSHRLLAIDANQFHVIVQAYAAHALIPTRQE
jgi:hypothetical protein